MFCLPYTPDLSAVGAKGAAAHSKFYLYFLLVGTADSHSTAEMNGFLAECMGIASQGVNLTVSQVWPHPHLSGWSCQ